jgi:hypothetical protein
MSDFDYKNGVGNKHKTGVGVGIAIAILFSAMIGIFIYIVIQNTDRNKKLDEIEKDMESTNAGMRAHMKPPMKQQMRPPVRLHSDSHVPCAHIPAPIPTEQLMASEYFPNTVHPQLSSLNSGKDKGLSANPIVGEGKSANSMSHFKSGLYTQDPAKMTPSTGIDNLGIEAYMPCHSDTTKSGLDPQTGLPVFSTSKLLRSNQLSSRGMHGFLRQVQDPYTGYKKLGRRMFNSSQQYQTDIERRREQFNEARLNGQDPVIFNTSGWAYF